MSINLKTLISKLNDTSRTAATRAAGICVGLGQYEVDLEHLFLALLEQPASDFALIARHSDEGQRRRYLPDVVNGSRLLTAGLTEPGRSDPTAPATTAEGPPCCCHE